MLKNLHVENFALIDKLEINFEPGLNIITGETGAGKSILIDALGSAIGDKIPADALRKGATKAITECLFDLKNVGEIINFLKHNQFDCSDNDLILRKEYSESGRNRAFVNDSPASNAALSAIGDMLVDLHGQHEHQALLKVNHHIKYLDDFGNYPLLLKNVSTLYDHFVELIDQLKNLVAREQSLSEKKELFQFQLNEINQLNLYPGEESELVQEEKLLGNSEKLYQLTSEVTENFYDSENSIFDRLSDGLSKLEDLSRIDDTLESIKKDCEAAQLSVQEIAKFLQSYLQNIEFNPDRLEQIRSRLGQLSGLKRKYNRSLDEIIDYQRQLETELAEIENLDASIEKKNAEIESQRQKLSYACFELTAARKAAAQKLEQLVRMHLAELGMKNALFEVRIQQLLHENGAAELEGKRYKTSQTGVDQVEFFIAANPGEDLKPLVKVASGGEVSRIMLALKSSLADADMIPVLIFDEIDMGISGRIAQAIGLSLKRLSKTHQIICITHLPQIASVADHHFVVEKTTTDNITRTRIRKLNEQERALEVAKLLGGEIVTETHINSAKELIEQSRQMNIGAV